MRQNILAVICILIVSITFAQVGINTTSPEKGAMLDVNSSDKGVFIPRVGISNLSTISPVTGIANNSTALANAQGLMVYNTNTNTGKGFYFWDGTKWLRITDASTTKNIATHNLTQNSESRTYNLNNEGINFSNGYVGIDTPNPSQKLEVNGNTQLTGTSNSNSSKSAGMLIYNNSNGLGGGTAKKVERLSKIKFGTNDNIRIIYDDPFVTLYCYRNVGSSTTIYVYLEPKSEASTGFWDYTTDASGSYNNCHTVGEFFVMSPNIATNYVGGAEIVINKTNTLDFPTYRISPHLHSTVNAGYMSVIVEAYYP